MAHRRRYQMIDGSLEGILTIADSIGTELLLQFMLSQVTAMQKNQSIVTYMLDDEAATL